VAGFFKRGNAIKGSIQISACQAINCPQETAWHSEVVVKISSFGRKSLTGMHPDEADIVSRDTSRKPSLQ
jgi:hypothetical protein